ncbi:inverse autotransporter beta domain-containing protein [Pantoea ananatis]
MAGNFDGTGGNLFSPLADENRYLTFSQLGLHDSVEGVVGNAGLGQRWDAGNWLLGVQQFYRS